MRAFVALLPARAEACALEATARALCHEAGAGRPVPARNMHITLAFLGEISALEAQTVKEALAALPAVSPILWPVAQYGVFGSALWIAGPKNPDIQMRATLVRSALKNCGIAFDTKPFRAHITLARSWYQDRPQKTNTILNVHLTGPVLLASVPDSHGSVRYKPV